MKKKNVSVYRKNVLTAALLALLLICSGICQGKLRAADCEPAFDFKDLFGKAHSDNTTGIELSVQDEKDVPSADKILSILQILKDNYYRELSTKELLEAMSRGVPSSLDSRYTYYLTPEENAAIEEEMSGEYSGIGCTVMLREGQGFELVDPVPGGPAEKAGIKNGDYLRKVNGKDATRFTNSQELVKEVRGKEGTTVTLGIYRPSENKDYEFTITRSKVVTQQVKSRKIDAKTAVVEIREFSNNLYSQFEPVMKDLSAAGIKDIVFDMRNNPGGDARALRECLDLLLDEGPICSIIGRQDGKQFVEKWSTSKGKLADGMRYAVLMNQNTASAAELFSGCLRDRLQVPLIGTKSYGKGSGTVSWSLEDGSAVNVTIFRYFLPKAEAIEGEGLHPSEEVLLPDSALTKSLHDLQEKEDTQLAKALDYFKSNAAQTDDTKEIEPSTESSSAAEEPILFERGGENPLKLFAFRLKKLVLI